MRTEIDDYCGGTKLCSWFHGLLLLVIINGWGIGGWIFVE